MTEQQRALIIVHLRRLPQNAKITLRAGQLATLLCECEAADGRTLERVRELERAVLKFSARQ